MYSFTDFGLVISYISDTQSSTETRGGLDHGRYRNEFEMEVLLEEVDRREAESWRVYFEPAGQVIVLEVEKKADQQL